MNSKDKAEFDRLAKIKIIDLTTEEGTRLLQLANQLEKENFNECYDKCKANISTDGDTPQMRSGFYRIVRNFDSESILCEKISLFEHIKCFFTGKLSYYFTKSDIFLFNGCEVRDEVFER